MRTNFPNSSGGRRPWWIILGLLVCLACWSAPGVVGKERDRQGARQDGVEGWAQVTWAQGRLSVDAKEASIQMILHRIGEQAGFSLNLGPIGQRTISVQFTDVELELGLRRLLQLASLSYAMQRAPRAGGRVALTKLWVFSDGQEAPHSHYKNVTRNDEATTHDTQPIQEVSAPPPNPFVDFFQQAQQQQAGQQVPQVSLAPQEASSTPSNPFVDFFQRMQK